MERFVETTGIKMPKFRIKARSVVVMVMVLANIGIFAQTTVTVDHALKKEVVIRVADFMNAYYVFPEIGKKMGEYIKQKHLGGCYDAYTEVKKFCAQLTSDLREVCHDKHIFVFYSPEEAREVAARKGILPEEEIRQINNRYSEMDRRANFGFHKVEVLEGNIGYLKIDYFSDSDEACERAVGAMKFLSGSDAIIIDLRSNGGGGGAVLPLLASYFFGSEKKSLTGVYLRATDSVEQSWTWRYVPGKRCPDLDLYILTSSRTFSAAEDFSYSLKHLKRATIVGENTKGGAHPVDVLIVKGDILTQISIGNSINPITNSNWENTGVKPDIGVPAEKALQAAHLKAVENLLRKANDDPLRGELAQLLKRMKQT